MKWLYYYKSEWFENGKNPVQTIYLRPTIYDEKGEQLVGKILQLSLVAMEYYFSIEKNPFDYEEALKIYDDIQSNQGYQILEREVEDDDFMGNVEIYLFQTYFDEKELFEWVNKYFVLKGYEISEFERASIDEFAELNSIMRLFSEKNVKKFEDKLGKEWWKKG